MSANEIREYLRKRYGIESDAQLVEERKKIIIDIGFFVSPVSVD